MSRSFDSMLLTTLPSMAIVPPDISSSPANMRSRVDLPHPDGPTSTMNSPSRISNPMPWMTLVLPKVLSMFWKVTDAMVPPQRNPGPSALYRTSGQAANHVALERIIDRRGRQRIDETDGHQQFPRRVVGGKEVPKRNRQGNLGVVGQKQECIQVFVPCQQQRIG